MCVHIRAPTQYCTHAFQQNLAYKNFSSVVASVSDPYSLNPDLDQAKNLYPYPESDGPRIRIQPIS